MLKIELDKLVYYEGLLPKYEHQDDFYNLIQKIRHELPRYIFDQETYPVDDCLDEFSKISRFISNPINAYRLIYRHVNIWNFVDITIRSERIQKFSSDLIEFTVGTVDILAARDAIYTLQTFISLNPLYISDGIISWPVNTSQNWTIVPKSLSVQDIFEIGKSAYLNNDFKASKDWFRSAYIISANLFPVVEENLVIDILDFLSWSEYKLEEYESAYLHSEIIIEINPKLEWVKSNLNIFLKSMQNHESQSTASSNDYNHNIGKNGESSHDIRILYENLIKDRNNINLVNSVSKYLCKGTRIINDYPHDLVPTCFIKKGKDIWGKYFRVNTEKIHANPDLYVFYSIMNDKEILELKKSAKHKIFTQKVNILRFSIRETKKYKIPKTQISDLDTYSTIQNLIARIKVSTGLNDISAEGLDVSNFGIGGYLNVKSQIGKEAFYKDIKSSMDNTQKQSAIFTLYMSDVFLGGKSVFPMIGLSIEQHKGDGIFWHNSLDNETKKMRYVQCPVALGSKWNANMDITINREQAFKTYASQK